MSAGRQYARPATPSQRATASSNTTSPLKQKRLDSFFLPQDHAASRNSHPHSPSARSNQHHDYSSSTQNQPVSSSILSLTSPSSSKNPPSSWNTRSSSNHRLNFPDPPASSSRPLSSGLSAPPTSSISPPSTVVQPKPRSSSAASAKRPLEADSDNDQSGDDRDGDAVPNGQRLENGQERPRKRRSRSPSITIIEERISQSPFSPGSTRSVRHSSIQRTSRSLLEPLQGNIVSSPLSSPPSVVSDPFDIGDTTPRRLVISSSQEGEPAAAPLDMWDNESIVTGSSGFEDIDEATLKKPVNKTLQPPLPELGPQHDTFTPTPAVRLTRSGFALQPQATPTYKNTLSRLVTRNEQNQALNAELTEFANALKRPMSTDSVRVRPEGPGQPILEVDKTLLESVIKHDQNEGDNDRVEKLMEAMNRTRTLHPDRIWYFTDVTAPTSSQTSVPSIPLIELSDILPEEVVRLLKTKVSRDQLFLTGGVNDLLGMYGLPLVFIEWVWQASILELRDDLRQSYRQFLAKHGCAFCQLLTPDHLTHFFEYLGARSEAVDAAVPIVAQGRPPDTPSITVPFQLIEAFASVTELGPDLPIDTITFIINAALRFCLDSRLPSNGQLQTCLQNCLALLVDLFPADSWEAQLHAIGEQIIAATQSLEQQSRLVSYIPNFTGRLATWRRKLSLTLFLNDDALFQSSLSTMHQLDLEAKVADHLSTSKLYPQSKYDTVPDFESVCAALSLLDVGVSNGFSPELPSSTAYIDNVKPTQAQVKPTMFRKEIPADARQVAISEHNERVDVLARSLRNLFGNISDTGLGNKSRLDAKSIIERLQHRLDYNVRTKPRVRKGMLGRAMLSDNHDAAGSHMARGRIDAFLTASNGPASAEPVLPAHQSPKRELKSATQFTDASAQDDTTYYSASEAGHSRVRVGEQDVEDHSHAGVGAGKASKGSSRCDPREPHDSSDASDSSDSSSSSSSSGRGGSNKSGKGRRRSRAGSGSSSMIRVL